MRSFWAHIISISIGLAGTAGSLAYLKYDKIRLESQADQISILKKEIERISTIREIAELHLGLGLGSQISLRPQIDNDEKTDSIGLWKMQTVDDKLGEFDRSFQGFEVVNVFAGEDYQASIQLVSGTASAKINTESATVRKRNIIEAAGDLIKYSIGGDVAFGYIGHLSRICTDNMSEMEAGEVNSKYILILLSEDLKSIEAISKFENIEEICDAPVVESAFKLGPGRNDRSRIRVFSNVLLKGMSGKDFVVGYGLGEESPR